MKNLSEHAYGIKLDIVCDGTYVRIDQCGGPAILRQLENNPELADAVREECRKHKNLNPRAPSLAMSQKYKENMQRAANKLEGIAHTLRILSK